MVNVAIDCGIFIAILVLLSILIGGPVIRNERKTKADFKAKQGKLTDSEGLIKSLPNPQKAIEDMEKKVEEFKGMGVSRKQMPKIIQLLGRSTSEHNINVISIKPREDISTEVENLPAGVTKVYIEMVMSSPYRVMGEYVKSLGELPVSFVIESVSIERKEGAVMPPAPEKKGLQPEKAEEGAENLLITLLLSTYMIWEI
jgi:Tfp pilus assembly protein PilO